MRHSWLCARKKDKRGGMPQDFSNLDGERIKIVKDVRVVGVEVGRN